MHGVPAPTALNLQLAVVAELEDCELITRVRATQWAHKYVWPKLHALYEAGLVLRPHKFQPADWVYVKRFRQDVLEPRWKGPANHADCHQSGCDHHLHYTQDRPADALSPEEDQQIPLSP